MLQTVKDALANALRLRRPGRALKVFDDDIFIVSYPRSGNTWVRFLIANLIAGRDDVGFINIENIVPDVYQNREIRLLLRRRPRILKSHEPYDGRYRRVVYLVRDPRDVAISYYNYQIMVRQVAEECALDDYVEQFLAGQVLFGSWQEHVDGWLGRRPDDDFLWMRYEDLAREPVSQLGRIAEFLKLGHDRAGLEAAVTRSTAKRMQALERQQWSRWDTLKVKRPDRMFVRAAVSEQWRRELPAPLADRIGKTWQATMASAGYDA